MGVAPEAEPAPGTRIGRYEIERRLGAGGMGVVYAAHDLHLRRSVALKLVGPRVESAFGQSRLVREAQAMASLRHPNLVTVHDIGVSDERLFVVMELVDGGTAADWLAAKPRSWREIVAVYLQAAHGLAAAHAAGFLHRDFKPENVLVGADGVARVSDFGVAWLLGDVAAGDGATGPGVVGTAGYIAPEILRDQPVDHRADQFSFCVALHAALHGVRPFALPDGSREIDETLGPIRPLSTGGVPRWLQRIIGRGLAAFPHQRWLTIDALATAIERRTRRSRGRVVAIASLLIAAALATTIAVMTRTRSMPPPDPQWSPVVIGLHDDVAGSRIAVSRDGSTLATLSRTDAWVEPRTGTGPRRLVVYPTSGRFLECKLSHHGDKLVCAFDVDPAGIEIWVLDVATGYAERRVPSGAAPRPTSRSGGFDIGADDSIMFSDLAAAWRVGPTGAMARVVAVEPGSKLVGPVSSPDGRRVAMKVRTAEGVRIDVLDLRTGAIATVSHRFCAGLEWLTDESLVCGPLTFRRPTVIELQLRAGGEAIERVRYNGPEYNVLTGLAVSSAGIALATSPNDQHLGLLPIDPPGELQMLASGSITDLPAAGSTSSGALIFGANVRGRLRIMAARPDGSIETVHTGTAAEVPVAVLGESIVFGRFPGGESTVPFFEAPLGRRYPDGELFRIDHPGDRPRSLGPTRGFHAMQCSTNPVTCLLAERSGGDVIAIDWDPQTGARGRERARWSMSTFPGTPQLSPDATTLAQIERFHGISLLDLATGKRRRVAAGQWRELAYATWQPDGTLLALAYATETEAWLVRVRDPDIIEKVIAQPLFTNDDDFRVTPNGKFAAVLVTNVAQTYWWVAKAPDATEL